MLRITITAEEVRANGRLPIDCVADNTRHILDIHQFIRKSNYSMEQVEQLLIPATLYYYNNRIIVDFDEKLQSWNDIITPQEHIQSGINYLNDTIKDLYDLPQHKF
jgi:hypothetical protein